MQNPIDRKLQTIRENLASGAYDQARLLCEEILKVLPEHAEAKTLHQEVIRHSTKLVPPTPLEAVSTLADAWTTPDAGFLDIPHKSTPPPPPKKPLANVVSPENEVSVPEGTVVASPKAKRLPQSEFPKKTAEKKSLNPFLFLIPVALFLIVIPIAFIVALAIMGVLFS